MSRMIVRWLATAAALLLAAYPLQVLRLAMRRAGTGRCEHHGTKRGGQCGPAND